MASYPIGDSLRAARTRIGWSREALAYHSGVSWSAIAQIESGRRKDVRISTLSALASALNVSVDNLVGAEATIAPQPFGHRVLPYGSEEELLAGAIPFLTEGIERSDGLIAVMTEAQLGLLSDGLGDRSDQVEFVNSADWYSSPGSALDRYRLFLSEKLEAGVPWIRVVGELPLTGLSQAEINAWIRYESIVNLVFASSTATIVCAYDTRSLPEQVVADARRNHPDVARGKDSTANPEYRLPEDFLLG